MDKYAFQYCQKMVVFSADGQSILLCRRQDEADYDGTFAFIGGKMEVTDLTLLAGLQREKNEEIGADCKIRIAPLFSLNQLYTKKDGHQMILPHYYAEYIEGEISLNEEYSEYRWVKLTELDAFEPKIETIPQVVTSLLPLKQVFDPTSFVVI